MRVFGACSPDGSAEIVWITGVSMQSPAGQSGAFGGSPKYAPETRAMRLLTPARPGRMVRMSASGFTSPGLIPYAFSSAGVATKSSPEKLAPGMVELIVRRLVLGGVAGLGDLR